MNEQNDFERSIKFLTEYWRGSIALIEETGFDEETGYAILSDDGYFEYLAVDHIVTKYTTEGDIQDILVTLKNYIAKLDSTTSFSFCVSFLSYVIQQRLEVEQGIKNNENSSSLSKSYSNLIILESMLSGIISNNFSKGNNAITNEIEISKRTGIKKPMDIKDFLMWVRIPILTKRLELEKGHLIEFITSVGKECGLEIKKGYASNIYDAIAKESYHDMLNDLLALIREYENKFNDDQSRKKENKSRQKFDQNPSGIKWNNN